MSASVIKRDQKKFGALIEQALPYVRGKMFLMLRRHGDAAIEDVTQNAAMRAWKYRHQFEGRSAFNTWFMRIAVNEALQWIRKAKVKEARNVSIDAPYDTRDALSLLSVLGDTLADTHLDPEKVLLSKKRREDLIEALDKTIAVNRRVLLMRTFHGFSTIETAEVLGMSQSTVKSRNRRAKAQVREHLAEVC